MWQNCGSFVGLLETEAVALQVQAFPRESQHPAAASSSLPSVIDSARWMAARSTWSTAAESG